jgi:hypothetical protein
MSYAESLWASMDEQLGSEYADLFNESGEFKWDELNGSEKVAQYERLKTVRGRLDSTLSNLQEQLRSTTDEREQAILQD